jgi:hypothetical protein
MKATLKELKHQFDLMSFARMLNEEFPYWSPDEVCFLLDCLEFHQKLNDDDVGEQEKEVLSKKFMDMVFEHCEAKTARKEYARKLKQRKKLQPQTGD